MPELPEVETVRRGLQRTVVGRTLDTVTVLHPRAVRRHIAGARDLESRLRGRRILGTDRRGKYLWMILTDLPDAPDGGEALLLHLGMSGQLLVGPADDGPHVRVSFSFADDGPPLRFVDQRTFGGLVLDALYDDVPAAVAHIARDPLDPRFDDDGFAAALLRRRTTVKRALLDQTLVSGVGNIYADEALWRARLHASTPASRLADEQVAGLLVEVRQVLQAALEAGGTSFDSLYVNVNGAGGHFERSLEAYGRTGKPCRRCGTPIVREAFMNRSSFFCPLCQAVPGLAGS